jgi:hypothetical protein
VASRVRKLAGKIQPVVSQNTKRIVENFCGGNKVESLLLRFAPPQISVLAGRRREALIA